MKGEEAALRLDRAERELSALKISSDRAMKNLLDARNDFSGDLTFLSCLALFPSIRVYLLYLSLSLTIYLYIDLFILYIYLWIYLSIDLYILLFG